MAKAVLGRPAKEIIDAAIEDNRWWERLCFGVILVCLAVGVAGAVVGMVKGDGLISLFGSAFAALFWPALRYTVGVRRDNIRIRLYEIALARAETSEQMAAILREIFEPARQSEGKKP